jgi:hypothetical protein
MNMKNQYILPLISLGALFIIFFGAMIHPSAVNKAKNEYDDNTSVWEVLNKLGKNDAPDLKKIEGASVEKGRDLVHKGYTIGPDGKKTSPISKFFVCTTCHNTKKEFEVLTETSPEKRLEYAINNNLPFLQASTFYGIVNRSSFYNDDYQIKYADEPGIKESAKDLRSAINFCAQECSQGRSLKDWEIESILAYFWTMQYQLRDLKLSQAEMEMLEKGTKDNSLKPSTLKMVESKYPSYVPAHFLKIPKFEKVDDSESNDVNRIAQGKAIFNHACLHCHLNKKYSFFDLEDNKLTLKSMESATRTENYIFSMYYLVREGLDPRMGHRSYMPAFTAENMCSEQL